MPDPTTSGGPIRKNLSEAVFALGIHLAQLPPGPLAELRRMEPGDGAGAFWRVYFAPKVALDQQKGDPFAWEWVIHALALLTPTGNDPEKRSAHDGKIPLGQALHDIKVSEARVSQVLEAGLDQRRDYLIRLVRMLAREGVRFNTTDLARLLLFAHDDPRAKDNALRRLAQTYYAAEAAAIKEDNDA